MNYLKMNRTGIITYLRTHKARCLNHDHTQHGLKEVYLLDNGLYALRYADSCSPRETLQIGDEAALRFVGESPEDKLQRTAPSWGGPDDLVYQNSLSHE